MVLWNCFPHTAAVAALRVRNTSEECELADWVTEVHPLLKVIKVHDVLEDKLKV